MPPIAVTTPAIRSTSQIEMWMPVSDEPTPTAPKWKLTCWNWPEASQPAV
jgi:hypothetical protein